MLGEQHQRPKKTEKKRTWKWRVTGSRRWRRKSMVQHSRLLEEADRKSRKEEKRKEKAAEMKLKRRVSKEELLRAEAAKSSKKITSFFAKKVCPEAGEGLQDHRNP